MTPSPRVRRPGYAPTNTAVGRRGMHTRDRIVARAGQLFVRQGYHGTSIDAIAKAVNGSRATVYQYFESKDDIFQELARQCEAAVLEHAARLGRLSPDAAGMRSLHQWLTDWAQLYDKYAMVFLEFPGIGVIEALPQTEAGPVAGQYVELITGRLRDAGISGIAPADAAAALLRIAHMVNLYRFRGMFDLPSAARTTDSLTVAMQLLLFPQTPVGDIAELGSAPCAGAAVVRDEPTVPAPAVPDEPPPFRVSPVRQDVLAATSALFNERGYYSVSMEDIAAAAAVSRATLYRHFSTKVKILEELTGWAVLEGAHLAVELYELDRGDINMDVLHSWLSHYVRLHRSYSGVIRAWYDGSLAEQLAGDAVVRGMGGFHVAVTALLERVQLPPGVDPRVAAAVFLSVLGRMTELSLSQQRNATDYDTADLMLAVLQRTLLGDLASRTQPSPGLR